MFCAAPPVYCVCLWCDGCWGYVLYCTVLFCIVLYCTVTTVLYFYCTVLCCTVLCCNCTALYCTAFLYRISVPHCTVLYCISLYSDVLYCCSCTGVLPFLQGDIYRFPRRATCVLLLPVTPGPISTLPHLLGGGRGRHGGRSADVVLVHCGCTAAVLQGHIYWVEDVAVTADVVLM